MFPRRRFFRLSRCYFGTSRLAFARGSRTEILPVPEALVFEADEYLFTMAAALGPFWCCCRMR